MSRGYAGWIEKLKWAIVALWVMAAAAVLIFLPKLPDVVSHQSTTYLPNSATSMVASNLASQVDPSHKSKSTVIVAIRNPNGLTSADKTYLEDKLNQVNNSKGRYHVTSIQDIANTSSASSKLISSDGTTEIALVGLNQTISDSTMQDTLNHLYGAFSKAPSGSNVYFTGDVAIQENQIHGTQNAADKTAMVTVILVLIILLVVFRSLLAPILTLLAIGLSYLVTSGVVAWAAQHGLPVSTFTQTFLIAVLFGAGTDYTVILMNRFREELTRSHDRAEALFYTLRGVLKTVIFSALTVFVSFAVLYFANFGLYRSAVGVAIGMLITLLTCITLIPSLMAILGRALYWPRHPKPGSAHAQSRIWGWTSKVSTKHPWVVLLIVVVVILPISLLFNGQRTLDPMVDIPHATAVKGFHTVANAFGPGQAMPTTVVLKSSGNLRTPDGLATINDISRHLGGMSNVKEVDSATQPLGSVISGFQLANQNQQAAKGLGQVTSGLSSLAGKLQSGASQTQQTTSGLQKLQSGSKQVTQGTQGLASGAQSLASNTKRVAGGANQVSSGVNKVGQSIGQLTTGANQLSQSENQLAQGTSQLANAIAAWAKAHPSESVTANWQQIQALAAQMAKGTAKAEAASKQVAGGLSQVNQSMPGLEKGVAGVASGSQKLASGATKLANSANQVAAGSQQVTTGIDKFSNGISSMGSSLNQASSAATKLKNGVSSTQQFLNQSSQASSPGFYVTTAEIKNNSDLNTAMNSYISPDGHIAKFTVVLKDNPYSSAAIHSIPDIQQNAQAALLASPMSGGQIYVGGTSAVQANMSQLSNSDFIRTMGIVFAAIFILLVLMLRSILTPLFILLSLGGTYFVTMGLVQTIAIHVLHHPGVNWTIPFFVFLLLVALGVDYSIFLMSRFDEEYGGGSGAERRFSRLATAIPMPMRAMRSAMRNMGNVVFSAALIMAGTFGSMVVTGMATMMEIGIAIVIGLFVYTFFLLAFFLPAAIAVIGPAHAWPFIHFEDDDNGSSPDGRGRYNRPVVTTGEEERI